MMRLARMLIAMSLLGSGAAAWEDPPAAPAAADTAMATIDTTVVHRAPRVPWLTDRGWDELVAEATERNRPILIDFTATWCGPCKLLDVMVFTEKRVINDLADVVTLKVDIDRAGADQLPRRFAVEVVPTLVWCDPTGRERDRFTGYVSSAEFLNTLATWRDGLTLDQALAARQAAAPESPAVLLELARRRAQRGERREAEVAYRRLMNLRHDGEPLTVARGMLGLAEMENAYGDADRARDLADRAATIFRQRSTEAEAREHRLAGLMEVAAFQTTLGDTLGALATWQQLAELENRNAAVLEGFARAALAADTRLEEATRAALRATVYSDKDAQVIAVLAECYARRRMYDRALRWIAQAIERDPGETRFTEQRERILEAREQRARPTARGMRGRR